MADNMRPLLREKDSLGFTTKAATRAVCYITRRAQPSDTQRVTWLLQWDGQYYRNEPEIAGLVRCPSCPGGGGEGREKRDGQMREEGEEINPILTLEHKQIFSGEGKEK